MIASTVLATSMVPDSMLFSEESQSTVSPTPASATYALLNCIPICTGGTRRRKTANPSAHIGKARISASYRGHRQPRATRADRATYGQAVHVKAWQIVASRSRHITDLARDGRAVVPDVPDDIATCRLIESRCRFRSSPAETGACSEISPPFLSSQSGNCFENREISLLHSPRTLRVRSGRPLCPVLPAFRALHKRRAVA